MSLGAKQMDEESELVLIIAADVLELGAPFTDPIADGPTIQTANTVRRSREKYVAALF